MLRKLCKNGLVFTRGLDTSSTQFVATSSQLLFKRNRSSNPQSTVADDTKLKTDQGDKEKPHSAKVLYDGECNICVHEIRVLRVIAKEKPVDFVDINTPDFTSEAFRGVTYEMAMKEMHVIGADGRVHVQGDAIREMYRSCGLGWLATATQLPGVKEVCDKMYIKFAEYRLEKALDRCDSGTSCSVKLTHLRDKLRPHQE
ncbi:uncharacterized protein [Littorina saxatilis]|uniref:uncharacterized protein n=1 Tax=Littorina saxatilis TaxID=31220 RepID=UPI0038B53752